MLAIFPQLLSLAQRGMIDHLAVGVRTYFEGKASPFLDMDLLIQAMGTAMNRSNLEEIGALVVQDQAGSYRVAFAVSKSMQWQELRFLKAHLLGHYLLNFQIRLAKGEVDKMGLRETMSPMQRYLGHQAASGHSNEEEICDGFAASLLMPSGMVKHSLARLADVEKVAKVFGVNENCLLKRIADIHTCAPLGGSPSAPMHPPSKGEGGSILSRTITQPTQSSQQKTQPLVRPGSANTNLIPDRPGRNSKVLTGSHPTSNPASSQAEVQAESAEPTNPKGGRGIERLREIARKMDKT